MTWESASEWTALVFLALWAGMLIAVAVGLVRATVGHLRTLGLRGYEYFYVARLRYRTST